MARLNKYFNHFRIKENDNITNKRNKENKIVLYADAALSEEILNGMIIERVIINNIDDENIQNRKPYIEFTIEGIENLLN